MALNVARIKKDFPVFSRKINGKQIHYLDNAASAQKPLHVIEAESDFYKTSYANIHRGVYSLSEQATEQFEHAREKAARFIGARPEEIVFTRGTTEGINMVARAWGGANLPKGGTVLISELEHHSNIVPWQMACQKIGGKVEAICIGRQSMQLDMDDARQKIAKKPTILAITHASNALGTTVEIEKLVKMAKEQGVRTLVDAAQSAPHRKIDVKKIGCDFLAFSGHKMLGPTGIGVLYISEGVQDDVPPFMGGGEMIKTVEIGKSTYAAAPARYEAGTPPIAQAIGLGAAMDYLKKIGLEKIHRHGLGLADGCAQALGEIDGVEIYRAGGPRHASGIVAFNIKGVHPHDAATILNKRNVMVRSGHHCAMPLHKKLGLAASCRASFYLYNSMQDVDELVEGVKDAKRIFA